MSGQTRRFKDSRFTGEDDEEEIDGCVAGTAGKKLIPVQRKRMPSVLIEPLLGV